MPMIQSQPLPNIPPLEPPGSLPLTYGQNAAPCGANTAPNAGDSEATADISTANMPSVILEIIYDHKFPL